MTYVNVGNELKTLLEGVSGIKAVFNYNEKKIEKYPAACIVAEGHENSFSDLAANRREYKFKIYLFHPTNTASSDADAEAFLRETVDQIITTIEGNVTLNGACEYAAPTIATWGYADREVPVRYVELIVTAKRRVNR